MIRRIMGLFLGFAAVLNGYYFYLSKSMLGVSIGIVLSVGAGILLYALLMPIKQILDDSKKILDIHVHQKISSKYEKSALGPVIQALKRLQMNNRALIGKLLTASDKIYAYSNDIRTYSKETEEGSKKVNQAVLKIAEQMERQAMDAGKTKDDISVIYKDIQEISAFANTSKEEAKNMEYVIRESLSIFEDITERLQNGSNTSRSLAQDIKQLENQANRIVDIVDVVTNISKQTSLLALNAAIEAARAGEEGRGFAVVADEVKKLANESTTSIEGIKGLIEDIIAQIKTIVEKMNHELVVVDENIQLASQAKEKFCDIQTATDTTAKAIHYIIALTEKEVEKIKNIDSFMKNVANAALEYSATAEETTTAAQHQAKVVQEIHQSIEKFSNMAKELKTLIMAYAQELRLDEESSKHVENARRALEEIAKKNKLGQLTSQRLREIQARYPYLELLAVTGTDGIVRTATVQLDDNVKDVRHREFYMDAIRGKIYVSKPYISSATDDYCVTISLPIRNEDGSIEGTLIGDVTL